MPHQNLTLIDETAYIKAVMDTVLDGLITINHKGIICSFNHSAEKIFGYEASDVVGKNVKILMPEPYHSGHDEYLTNYLTSGEKKVIGIGREVAAQRKDGSVFPMELGVNEMQISGQRMFVVTIRDISERKINELKIKKMVKNLKASNEELETFVYIASHDLRSPLVNLKGFSQEILYSLETITPIIMKALDSLSNDEQEIIKKELTHRIPKSAAYIVNSADKMDSLTSAILQLSRLGRSELVFEKIDTQKLAEQCKRAFEHQILEKNCTVTVDNLPFIVGSKSAFEQIISNLLDNAIKYLAPNKPGKISISAKQTDQKTTFSITDNGLGIAADNMHKVFEIFRRADTIVDVPGEGMGIAFIKVLINRHKGKIWCKSVLGEGSTFFFTLSNKLPEGANVA